MLRKPTASQELLASAINTADHPSGANVAKTVDSVSNIMMGQDWPPKPQDAAVADSLEAGSGYQQGKEERRQPTWAAAVQRRLPPWCEARPCRAAILVVLLIKLLAVLLVATGPELLKGARNALRLVYYSSDPMLFGRNDVAFPAPHCCVGAACAQPHTGRVAVLTYIRSDNYLPLLKHLECSFRRSNPGVELGVMSAPGELGAATKEWLEHRNLTLIEVQPLYYPNYHTPRYGQNWLKLRALSLMQYDAVLLIDSDTVVLGDVRPVFSLPVEFAAVWDQNKWLGRYNTRLPGGINGGVLLLRPCPAMLLHMVELLDTQPKLRFSHGAAEQDFFTWYYRYTGMMLPVEYNTMASDSLAGNLTIGGRPPVVVHFTQHKPFGGAVPGRPGHNFLCSAEEMQLR
ncbi:hypothetical protein N2152v2_001398 [Parachlorella kessleri]